MFLSFDYKINLPRKQMKTACSPFFMGAPENILEQREKLRESPESVF